MNRYQTSRIFALGTGLILALGTIAVGSGPAVAGHDDPVVTTPSDFQVDTGAGSVTVDWEPSVSDAGEITIYYVKLDGAWHWSENSAMTFDLESSRTYTLTVQAQDASYNRSDWSEPIEITTSDEPAVTAPGNVQVTESPGAVTVQWEPSASDAGVRDYVATLHGAKGGPVSRRTSDTTATFSYPPGGDLEVTVRAQDNAYRWSDTADPIAVTIAPSPDWTLPSTPTDFRAADSPAGVLFEWSEPADGVGPFTYEIFLAGDQIETVRGDVRLESPYFRECGPGQAPMEFTITATSNGFTSPPSDPISLCFR